jgi:hypothetical protein
LEIKVPVFCIIVFQLHLFKNYVNFIKLMHLP